MPDPRFCAGCGVPIRIGGKTIHKPGCIRRLTMPDDQTPEPPAQERWRVGTEGRWIGDGDYDSNWVEYESKGKNGQFYKRHDESVYAVAERLNALEARAEADRQELEAWKRQAQELEAHADDYSQQNIGAAITAQMLLEIRETGQHKGTFGGEDIEKVAQAILADRQRIAELEGGREPENEWEKPCEICGYFAWDCWICREDGPLPDDAEITGYFHPKHEHVMECRFCAAESALATAQRRIGELEAERDEAKQTAALYQFDATNAQERFDNTYEAYTRELTRAEAAEARIAELERETDAQDTVIQGLKREWRAAEARIAELERDKQDNGALLAMIAATLEAIGCKHGDSRESTPPMMYAEWIECVVQSQVAAAEAEREALETRNAQLVKNGQEWITIGRENDRLMAERDALRAALELITGMVSVNTPDEIERRLARVLDIARRALTTPAASQEEGV